MINTSSETKNVFWRQRMNDWKTSGLNQRAYCTVNNISLVTFGYWRKKFQAEEEKINGKMIPILLTESHSNQENNVILDSIYVHRKPSRIPRQSTLSGGVNLGKKRFNFIELILSKLSQSRGRYSMRQE